MTLSTSARTDGTRTPLAMVNRPEWTRRAYVPAGTRSRFSCASIDGRPGAIATASQRPFFQIATAADHERPAPKSTPTVGRPERSGTSRSHTRAQSAVVINVVDSSPLGRFNLKLQNAARKRESLLCRGFALRVTPGGSHL